MGTRDKLQCLAQFKFSSKDTFSKSKSEICNSSDTPLAIRFKVDRQRGPQTFQFVRVTVAGLNCSVTWSYVRQTSARILLYCAHDNLHPEKNGNIGFWLLVNGLRTIFQLETEQWVLEQFVVETLDLQSALIETLFKR